MTNGLRHSPTASAPPPVMLPHDEQREAEERCADQLIQLVAQAQVTTTIDADVDTQADESEQAAAAAFHRWRAHEARACQSIPARRLEAEHAARFAARLVAVRRVAAVTLPVVTDAPTTFSVDACSELGGAVGQDRARARYAPCTDFAVAAGAGREIWDEPTTTVIELPDSVPAGNYLALAVHGDSMRPLLHPGDTLLVKREQEWRRGALVVAHRPEHGYVVKQVGHMTAETVELTSLNPEYPSVLIPRDGQLLVGSVVLRWCPHAQ